METYEVLEAALERLGPKGERWYRGSWSSLGLPLSTVGELENTDAEVCALGAIDVALGESRQRWGASIAALKAAGEMESISDWNDHPDRTFADVKAAFQKAIASEKAKAGVLLDVDLGGGSQAGALPSGAEGPSATASVDAAEVNAEAIA